MTEIGPIEAEMRARARDVRSRFFAPKPVTIHIPTPKIKAPARRKSKYGYVLHDDGRVTWRSTGLSAERDVIIPRRLRRVVLITQRAVAKKHGVHPNHIFSHAKNASLCAARMEMIWRLCVRRGISQRRVADIFGMHDSTVTRSCGQHLLKVRKQQIRREAWESVQ